MKEVGGCFVNVPVQYQNLTSCLTHSELDMFTVDNEYNMVAIYDVHYYSFFI